MGFHSNDRIEAVDKLHVVEHDIVHVKVGGEIVIDGVSQTWVPTMEDVQGIYAAWAPMVLARGADLICSHHLIESTILASKLNISTWPTKRFP